MNKHLLLTGCLALGFLFCRCEDGSLVNGSSPSMNEVMPTRASAFFNSIGVNTHIGFYDTNYADFQGMLKPRLLELGVKHIRDGNIWGGNSGDTPLTRCKELEQYGINLLLICFGGDPVVDDPVERAGAFGQMLWGIEPVNEPDLNKKPGEWEQHARNEQQRVFTAARSIPGKQVPVLGIALAENVDNPSRLGNLSSQLDFGNLHLYASGLHPTNQDFGNYWGTRMEVAISKARLICGEKPLIITEAGYHNYENSNQFRGCSEKAAAIYHVHLPFVYYNAGVSRTYIYELLDWNKAGVVDDMNMHYGLIRADGSAKPSFRALKNLLSIVKEEEVSYELSPLKFGIDPTVKDIEYTLLQKQDGSHWLALFRKVNVYDVKTHKDIEVDPVNVNVEFAEIPSSIDMYIPNQSDQIIQSLKTGDKISLQLGAELVLLKIK